MKITDLKTLPKKVLIAKRIFDLFFCITFAPIILTLLLTLSIIYLISFIFRPEDKGPLFRRLIRSGNGGAVNVFKFRLMKTEYIPKPVDEEKAKKLIYRIPENEQRYILKNIERLTEEKDKHLTLTGSFLKKFYFDELPQFFNILSGDLSLVGVRPVSFIDKRVQRDEHGRIKIYDNAYDYSCRDRLPAGLTGLFQRFKTKEALDDYKSFMIKEIECDWQYYDFLKTKSILKIYWTDMKVAARTLLTVLRHGGV